MTALLVASSVKATECSPANGARLGNYYVMSQKGTGTGSARFYYTDSGKKLDGGSFELLTELTTFTPSSTSSRISLSNVPGPATQKSDQFVFTVRNPTNTKEYLLKSGKSVMPSFLARQCPSPWPWWSTPTKNRCVGRGEKIA